MFRRPGSTPPPHFTPNPALGPPQSLPRDLPRASTTSTHHSPRASPFPDPIRSHRRHIVSNKSGTPNYTSLFYCRLRMELYSSTRTLISSGGIYTIAIQLDRELLCRRSSIFKGGGSRAVTLDATPRTRFFSAFRGALHSP